jgi:hypothetical protein
MACAEVARLEGTGGTRVDDGCGESDLRGQRQAARTFVSPGRLSIAAAPRDIAEALVGLCEEASEVRCGSANETRGVVQSGSMPRTLPLLASCCPRTGRLIAGLFGTFVLDLEDAAGHGGVAVAQDRREMALRGVEMSMPSLRKLARGRRRGEAAGNTFSSTRPRGFSLISALWRPYQQTPLQPVSRCLPPPRPLSLHRWRQPRRQLPWPSVGSPSSSQRGRLHHCVRAPYRASAFVLRRRRTADLPDSYFEPTVGELARVCWIPLCLPPALMSPYRRTRVKSRSENGSSTARF